MSKSAKRALPFVVFLCVLILLLTMFGLRFIQPKTTGTAEVAAMRLTVAKEYIALIDDMCDEFGNAARGQGDGPIGLLYADASDLDNNGVEELITIHNSPATEPPQLRLHAYQKGSSHLMHTMPLALTDLSFRIGFTVIDGQRMLVIVSTHTDDNGHLIKTTVFYAWDGSSLKEEYTYTENAYDGTYTINGKEHESSQYHTLYENRMEAFYELLLNDEHLELLKEGVNHTKERLQAILDTEAAEPTVPLEPITATAGDSIFFGRYEQDNNLENGPEPIEWIVLGHAAEGGVYVTSRYGLYTPHIQPDYDATYTWEISPFRTWLADEFLPTAFTPSEQQCILPTEVSDDRWVDSGDYGLTVKQDRFVIDQVYLMNLTESKLYFSSDEERCLSPTPHANALGAYRNKSGNGLWWLRTPGSDGYFYDLVEESGGFPDQLGDYGLNSRFLVDYNTNVMLRPMMRLSAVTPQEGVTAPDLTYRPRSFETIAFGRYEQDGNTANGQEPIEWLVLDEQEGRRLLLSKQTLDCREFHDTYVQELQWKSSGIYGWLNDDFQSSAFSDTEQAALHDDGNGKVFFLSKDEVTQYLPLDIDRVATPTDYALSQSNVDYTIYTIETPGSHNWLLRTMSYGSPYGVDNTGFVGIWYFDFIGIRPAVWVDSTALGLPATDNTDSTTTAATTTTAPKNDDAWKSAYLNALQNIPDEEFGMYDDSEFVLRYIDGDDVPELFVISPYSVYGTPVYSYYDDVLHKTIISKGGYTYIPKENCFRCEGGRQDYYHDVIYAMESGDVVEKQRGETHVAEWTESGPIMGYIRWDGVDMSYEEYEAHIIAAIDPNRAVSLQGDDAVYTYSTIQEVLSR